MLVVGTTLPSRSLGQAAAVDECIVENHTDKPFEIGIETSATDGIAERKVLPPSGSVTLPIDKAIGSIYITMRTPAADLRFKLTKGTTSAYVVDEAENFGDLLDVRPLAVRLTMLIGSAQEVITLSDRQLAQPGFLSAEEKAAVQTLRNEFAAFQQDLPNLSFAQIRERVVNLGDVAARHRLKDDPASVIIDESQAGSLAVVRMGEAIPHVRSGTDAKARLEALWANHNVIAFRKK